MAAIPLNDTLVGRTLKIVTSSGNELDVLVVGASSHRADISFDDTPTGMCLKVRVLRATAGEFDGGKEHDLFFFSPESHQGHRPFAACIHVEPHNLTREIVEGSWAFFFTTADSGWNFQVQSVAVRR